MPVRPVLIVRALVPDEWQVLRALRLAALADAADAFGSSYESAANRTEHEWRVWPARGVPLVAFLSDGHNAAEGGPVGVVGAESASGDPLTCHLISMWVAPVARGTGVGDALITAVVDW